MPNWLDCLLKEIAQVEKMDNYRPHCQLIKPFQLIQSDGTPFTVFALSKGCFFESSYFTFISFNERTSCIVLEVLLLSCCGTKLFRTEARISIELSCFCGFQMINLPTFDCMQKLSIRSNQICIPFRATKNGGEKIVYRTKQRAVDSAATVTVHYKGPDPELELLLNTNQKTISFIIPKDHSQSMTVSNLKSIEIVPPNESVVGDIDIQLNYFKEKVIYF